MVVGGSDPAHHQRPPLAAPGTTAPTARCRTWRYEDFGEWRIFVFYPADVQGVDVLRFASMWAKRPPGVGQTECDCPRLTVGWRRANPRGSTPRLEGRGGNLEAKPPDSEHCHWQGVTKNLGRARWNVCFYPRPHRGQHMNH